MPNNVAALLLVGLSGGALFAAAIPVQNASFDTILAGGLTQNCGAGCTFSRNGGIPDWVL